MSPKTLSTGMMPLLPSTTIEIDIPGDPEDPTFPPAEVLIPPPLPSVDATEQQVLFADVFRLWVYSDADGTQGDSLRDETNITSPVFLDGVTWAHVKLTQSRYNFWKEIPRIEFVVKGIKINAPRDRIDGAIDLSALGFESWDIPYPTFVANQLRENDGATRVTLTLFVDSLTTRDETRVWDGSAWISVDDATNDIPVWSNNASDIRYWFMRHRRGLPAADFDNASIRDAEALCGESVNVLIPLNLRSQYANYPENVNRYTIDGIITSEDSAGNTEDEMDYAWQGQVINVGGTYHFRPGKERTPVRTLNVAEDAISIESTSVFPELNDLINELSCTLEQSAAHDWTTFPVLPLVDTFLQNAQGFRIAPDLGHMRFISNVSTANRLMATMLRRARATHKFVYTVKPGDNFEWFGYVPTDRIRINDAENGLDDYLAEIVSLTANEDWTIQLEVQASPNGIYIDSVALPPLTPAPIDISDPGDVIVPANVTATPFVDVSDDGSAYSGYSVSWDEVSVAGTDLRYRLSGESVWQYAFSVEPPIRIYPLVGRDARISGATYQHRADKR